MLTLLTIDMGCLKGKKKNGTRVRIFARNHASLVDINYYDNWNADK
jgi:hypothetical protein